MQKKNPVGFIEIPNTSKTIYQTARFVFRVSRCSIPRYKRNLNTLNQFIYIGIAAVLTCFFGVVDTFGQKAVENFPVQFTQFATAYSNINPASIGFDTKNKATAGYQKPLQGFEGVVTYYLSLFVTPGISQASKSRKNVLGLRVYSDKEGAYIKRNRFYGMYAYHTRLFRKINFAGGIDFGAVNFAIKSTPTTGGVSNYVFDANTGIWLYGKGFHAGISLNQVFKSDIKPIDELTTLPFHFNVTASKTIFNSKNFELKPHVLLTFPHYSELRFRGCLESVVMRKVTASLGFNYGQSIYFVFGLTNIEALKQSFELAVSYEMQTKSVSYKLNTLEISIGYKF